jgi:hypothetical protein
MAKVHARGDGIERQSVIGDLTIGDSLVIRDRRSGGSTFGLWALAFALWPLAFGIWGLGFLN